ncbi:hypothetical protein PG630_01165 [Riemerella anatipestifer]|nr:hypothetical protein [Riemerella anatipestifer]
MKIIKYITCITVHCFLFWLSISCYQQYKDKYLIIETTSPIKAYVLDIHYRAKSANTCDVMYKGKEYRNIIFYDNEVKKNTFNSNSFYYYKEKDWIFCRGNEKVQAIAYFVFFILSFLLWLMPEERFSLKW